MIAESAKPPLPDVDRAQLEVIDLARGSWASGQLDNALLLLESPKREGMSPRVAAECFVVEAACLVDKGDREGSRSALHSAAPHIDHAPISVQGAFFHQRARLHKEDGNLDAALMDYAGAEARWLEIGAIEKAAAVVLNLAGVRLLQRDFRQAHECVNRSIETFTKTNSIYLCQAYDTQAQIYLCEGKLRAAFRSIHQALALVGENDSWKKEFEITNEKIVGALIDLIKTAGFDVNSLQKEMVRRALIKHGGNLTKASKEIGMSRKGISYVVDHNEDLEPLRVERRVRHARMIK